VAPALLGQPFLRRADPRLQLQPQLSAQHSSAPSTLSPAAVDFGLASGCGSAFTHRRRYLAALRTLGRVCHRARQGLTLTTPVAGKNVDRLKSSRPRLPPAHPLLVAYFRSSSLDFRFANLGFGLKRSCPFHRPSAFGLSSPDPRRHRPRHTQRVTINLPPRATYSLRPRPGSRFTGSLSPEASPAPNL
jgi:hypothetical protein